MKMKQQVAPECTTNADGQQLVHVTLANSGQQATLYAEDYQRLMAAGFSPCWGSTADGQTHTYPTLWAYTDKGASRKVPVARLIVLAEAGQIMRYADGNPLNLRSENLKLERGTARFNAADWYPSAAALHAAKITPKPKDWREGSRPPRKAKRGQTPHAHTAPVRPAAAPQTPAATAVTERAPAAPREPYTPPTIDTQALAQRVRERVAAGVSYSGGSHP